MKNKRENIKDSSNYSRSTYDYQSYRKNRYTDKNVLRTDDKFSSRERDYKKKLHSNVHSNNDDKSGISNKSSNQKRAKKNRRMGRTGVVVVIFILIYIPSLFNWLYGNNISTGIIYSGKIEDAINTNALIIKDEILIKASFDGKFIPVYEEGEKVAANSIIATILKESSSNLLDDVNEINKKIIFAQNGKSKVSDVFSHDIKKLDKEIGYKVNSLINEINNNKMDCIRNLQIEINEVIQRKAIIIGNEQSDDVYIQSLKEQKKNLEKQMTQIIEEKRTEFSGIVSYTIDGYENILTTGAMKDITPETFNTIMLENTQNTEKEYRIANADKPFAKIKKDLGCYLLVCQDANSIDFLKEGDYINIRINDINKTIKSTVFYISKKQSGKQMVALKIDKYTNELSTFRKLNVDLIKSTYEGLMVPLRCLLGINKTKMTANIIIIKANYASIREVVINGINNEYAVISCKNKDKGISLYDTYIMNPKNIHDGQVISQ